MWGMWVRGSARKRGPLSYQRWDLRPKLAGQRPRAACRREPTRKRTPVSSLQQTSLYIKWPTAQCSTAARIHSRGADLESLRKEKGNGLPATPKGRRRPEVSFLVLLSLNSMRPTRTIWHTKLIFSLFRSLLPRSWKYELQVQLQQTVER